MPILRMLATALMALSLSSAAHADASDSDAIQAVISAQLAAIQARDAPRAFSFAAPTIRDRFGTAENFMTMVRQGYAPLYRARSFTFGPLGDHHGAIMQFVRVIDVDGAAAHALYIMERQADGGWRIAGCMLTDPPGQGA